MAGCGLDTSGIAGPTAWLDAPLNNIGVSVGRPVAIMAHTSRSVSQMLLLINEVPVVSLSITQPGDDLWEGSGSWTPVAIVRY